MKCEINRWVMYTRSLLGFFISCGIAAAATINGSVTDAKGVAMPGVKVVLTPSHARAGVSGNTSAAAVSAVASGAAQFFFGSVAPGSYDLCVIPGDRVHLNSCFASSGGMEVKVAAETDTIQQNVTVDYGVEVSLIVTPNSDSREAPSHVFLASKGGGFQRMENDALPMHFWTVVPAGTSWRVVTFAAGGAARPPSELIEAGVQGTPVSITIVR